MRIAEDGEEFRHESAGQVWLVSWHPASAEPRGKAHGSAAVCVTADASVLLISGDGESWSLPGGRTEADEGWRQTLDREVLEEGCALVEDATLLGFMRGTCIEGHEKGLVLVRAHWRAAVTLAPWEPRYETTHRRLASPEEALDLCLRYPPSPEPAPDSVYRRLFREALASP
jgi:ADP-ribose pyrophosphatase YjhB (NUDIX family)